MNWAWWLVLGTVWAMIFVPWLAYTTTRAIALGWLRVYFDTKHKETRNA